MVSITERLPHGLSERIAAASAAIYNRQGREVDCAIAGIPFLYATSQDTPHTVETIKIRTEQLDTERDPGEQSLTGWWRRAQSTWHGGAGFRYAEVTDDNADGIFYSDSRGIDVHTPGEIRLLRRMKQTTGSGTLDGANVRGYMKNGEARFSAVSVASDDLVYSSASNDRPGSGGGLPDTFHNPTAFEVIDGFISPGTTDAGYTAIWDGTEARVCKVAAGATAATGSTLTAATRPTKIQFGLHRLWLIAGNKIFQPTQFVSATAALWANPDDNWTYTDIAEGPAAMYFAGHNGSASNIQLVTLDNNGATPTLSGATVAAVMPDGELVQRLAVVGGSLIGIGTTRGFRVGVLREDGAITYGPLILDVEDLCEKGDAAAAKSFETTCVGVEGNGFLVGFRWGGTLSSSEALLYRVDTGVELSEGVFAYAPYHEATGRCVRSVATVGGRLVMSVENTGGGTELWYRSDTGELVPTGWIETGRIRFRTIEKKQFKKLGAEIEPLAGGSVAFELRLDNDTLASVGVFNTVGELITAEYELAGGPMRWCAIRTTLAASGSTGPVLNQLVLKALPSVRPQLLISVPLLCYDKEQARSGQRYGGASYAADRLAALRELEAAGETVTFQDFSSWGAGGQRCVIESIRSVQLSPGPPVRAEGAGGLLLVELRTVT